MWYALIHSNGSCDAYTSLAWGENIEEVRKKVLEECETLIDSFCDYGVPFDKLEDEYYCDLDRYLELDSCTDVTKEMVEHFWMQISDCSISVACLVEGYAELVKAFNQYKDDKWSLDEWQLVPEIDENDKVLSWLDEELRSLNEDWGSVKNLSYFLPCDDEIEIEDE